MGNNLNHSINANFDFPPIYEKKVIVFVGAYGSGKSEVAVNTALVMAEQSTAVGEEIVLVDLDIINPFYRSFDAKHTLAEGKVRIIASKFANTNVEAPSVPGEVSSIFDQANVRAVVDIGGEDMGARIVAVLEEKIVTVSYELLMVVNLNRPFTNTAERVISMMRELETASDLRITGLVNNTNLLDLTLSDELLQANNMLRDVSEMTGVPLCFAAGVDNFYPNTWYNTTLDGLPFLRMNRTIHYTE